MNEINEENEIYSVDIVSSNSINRMSMKFLFYYLAIFWISGWLLVVFWYDYITLLILTDDLLFKIILISLFPVILFLSYFIFIFGCMVLSKLFLILINLIYKPKEGIFIAKKGEGDYDFWILRTQVKKLVVWLINNSPLPWINIWSFKWFGVKVAFSDSLTDAWCDVEFIKFGKKILIGQGAVVMSSMILGNYLIIKKITIDDYSVIGGHSTISPGTVVGKDTIIGALAITSFNQILEKGWIYLGFPVIKLKLNKYAEMDRTTLRKIDVDQSKKFKVKYEVNIDEDKKDLV